MLSTDGTNAIETLPQLRDLKAGCERCNRCRRNDALPCRIAAKALVQSGLEKQGLDIAVVPLGNANVRPPFGAREMRSVDVVEFASDRQPLTQ